MMPTVTVGLFVLGRGPGRSAAGNGARPRPLTFGPVIDQVRGWVAERRTGRRAHRGRHLDRQRHPRLPRPERGLDQEPEGRAHVPHRPLRGGSRGPAAGLAATGSTHPAWTARAQRRPPGAGRPRAPGQAAHADHPERRRAAPGGRQRPGAGGRGARHRARGRCACRCDERAPMERALDRVRAGEDDPPCRTCGGILKSATISFGQNARSRRPRAGPSWPRCSCDLLLAVGTTLTVYPAAGRPGRGQVGRRPGRRSSTPSRPTSTTRPTPCSGARSTTSSRPSSLRADLGHQLQDARETDPRSPPGRRRGRPGTGPAGNGRSRSSPAGSATVAVNVSPGQTQRGSSP